MLACLVLIEVVYSLCRVGNSECLFVVYAKDSILHPIELSPKQLYCKFS